MNSQVPQVAVLVFVLSMLVQAQNVAQPKKEQPKQISVETFQVLDLPLNLTEVMLQETEKGYVLNGSLANSSDQHILGLRYLLMVSDSVNAIRALIPLEEGCKLEGYATKSIKFETPLRLKLKKDSHLALIIEQVTGEDSIWEVIRSKQALERYVSGDYSITPKVLQVSNQVDVPPQKSVIYQLNHR
jgi:hypothetical protein